MHSRSRMCARQILTGVEGALLASLLVVTTTANVRAEEVAKPAANTEAPVVASATNTNGNANATEAGQPTVPDAKTNSDANATDATLSTPATGTTTGTTTNTTTGSTAPDATATRKTSVLRKAVFPPYQSIMETLGLSRATAKTRSIAQTPAPAKPTPATGQAAPTKAAPAAGQAAPADATPPTRALPSPLDNPPYPFTDWTINSGFPIGESWDVAPGPLQHALFGTKLDNTKFRFGGWMDTGIVVSNARFSNLPDTYNLIPKHPELDQLVFVAQKMVDTVQKDHMDWGFYSAHLFGIDYRFTSAKGVLDDQLLKHNNLYGYDPVLQWAEVYFPKVADGTVMQIGRYISPIDIEAQLSNSNYLYSHSIMFGVDPYTYTGINFQFRLSKTLEIMAGIHAGNENTPWSGAANANGELLIGWSSPDNKDSLWGGLDSFGSGRAIRGHDNEQILNFVWGHKFNNKLHNQMQGYYMFEYGATVGGTPINGPAYSYASSGLGAAIPGKAYAVGFVDNLEYQVNKDDYISFRSGYLNDAQGWRTGVATHYTDFTLGYSHLFKKYWWIRPELRWDHSYDAASFDNGTKRDLLSIAGDIIFRF